MPDNLFHAQSIKKVFKELSSQIEGLSLDEAINRLEKFGLNEIAEKKAVHPIFTFLKQFRSWLIYILIGAALFSFFYRPSF